MILYFNNEKSGIQKQIYIYKKYILTFTSIQNKIF